MTNTLYLNLNETFPIRREGDALIVDLSSADTQKFWENISTDMQLRTRNAAGEIGNILPTIGAKAKTLTFALHDLATNEPLQLVLRGQPVAEFTSADADSLTATDNHPLYQLSVSETRGLSNVLNLTPPHTIPYDRKARRGFDPALHAPITDLHTHSSAQLSGADLFAIALEADVKASDAGHYVTYPVELLEKLGVPASRGQTPMTVPSIAFNPLKSQGLQCEQSGAKCQAIRLKYLTDEQRAAIIKAMDASEDKRQSFQDIEKSIYRFSNPFTKNPHLTKAMLRKIAENYAAQGIEYAEMATSSMLNPEWFQAMVEVVDEIENGTLNADGSRNEDAIRVPPNNQPMRLRFLVGLARNTSPAETMPILEKMKFLARHPYIVGIDLMGNETNQTSDFHWALTHMAMWARQSESSDLQPEHGWNFKEDFLIRVHAGETSKNPNNVADAARIANTHKVRVRVGHGQYAELTRDDKTMLQNIKSQAGLEDKQTGEKNPDDWFGFEICPDSNVYYKMKSFVHQVELKNRLPLGQVVLGSDGSGMLAHTSPRQLAYSAMACGMTLDELAQMRQQEVAYTDRQSARDAKKTAAFLKHYPGGNSQFFTEYRAFNAEEIIAKRFANKTPILIGGASGSSWTSLSNADQTYIEWMMNLLVETLNPKTTYFVLGRVQNEGVSKALDKAIIRHNLAHPANKFDVFARYAVANDKDSPVGELAESVSGLEFIPGGLDEVPESMTSYIRTHHGKALFFGGGDFTAKMMQSCATEDAAIPFAAFMPKRSAVGAIMRDATDPKQQLATAADLLRLLTDTEQGIFVRSAEEKQQLLRPGLALETDAARAAHLESIVKIANAAKSSRDKHLPAINRH